MKHVQIDHNHVMVVIHLASHVQLINPTASAHLTQLHTFVGFQFVLPYRQLNADQYCALQTYDMEMDKLLF